MSEVRELNKAVTVFSKEMKTKLQAKRGEGWYGWDCPAYKLNMIHKLQQHVTRLVLGDVSQAVDIANFAMFLWNIDRQEPPKA